ncbi:MAG: helix-turn-helix domain-containing protein [Spirochaetes bacterium]|nr:helix-turn-helix domain-containing protein [Spirochaetota bacterium]
MNLGSIIRKHRKELKLTMKEVAERAKISEGFLSQIENNVNTPSVDTLMNICNAIGINAGDVLNQVKNREKFVVIRKSDWGDIDIPQSGFATKRFFSPDNRTDIDTAVLVIREGKTIPVRKNIRNSQEILCVLRGKVELELGEDRVTLSEGDAIHYWSNPAKQMIIGKSKTDAVVAWTGTL